VQILVDAVDVQALEVEGRRHRDEGEERHKQPCLAQHGDDIWERNECGDLRRWKQWMGVDRIYWRLTRFTATSMR
jgi:hypothetical protein